MEANSKQVVIPKDLDVLCGSGQKVNRHPGNMRFRQVVTSHLESYTVAVTKSEKSSVSQTVLEELTSTSGARFLKKHSIFDEWYVATDKAARDKISHCLRRMTREQQEQQADGRRGREAAVVQPHAPPAPEPAPPAGVAVASAPLLPEARQVSPNESSASHGDDLLLVLQRLQEGTQQLRTSLPAEGVISSNIAVIDPGTSSLYEPSRSFPPSPLFASSNAAPNRGNPQPDPAFLNLNDSPNFATMQPASSAPQLKYPAQESFGSTILRESAPASCFISSSGGGTVVECDQVKQGATTIMNGKMTIEHLGRHTTQMTMPSQEGGSTTAAVLLGHATRSGVSRAYINMASHESGQAAPAPNTTRTSKLCTTTTLRDETSALPFRPNQEARCLHGPPAG